MTAYSAEELYIVMSCYNEEAGPAEGVTTVRECLRTWVTQVLIAEGIFLACLVMILWGAWDFFSIGSPGGWAMLTCSLWFLGGLFVIYLSIVGEYMGKMYLAPKKTPALLCKR